MPCQDLRETLEIRLAPDGVLLSFHLAKGTCGAVVGGGHYHRQLLGHKLADFLPDHPLTQLDQDKLCDEEVFLGMKEHQALCDAAAAYFGLADSGPDAAFAMLTCEDGPEGTTIVGLAFAFHLIADTELAITAGEAQHVGAHY